MSFLTVLNIKSIAFALFDTWVEAKNRASLYNSYIRVYIEDLEVRKIFKFELIRCFIMGDDGIGLRQGNAFAFAHVDSEVLEVTDSLREAEGVSWQDNFLNVLGLNEIFS